jgi:voltage-gated potassium channel
MKLKVLFDNSTKAGKIFDLSIQILIIISIISFSIETIPDINEKLSKALSITELISVLIFSVEYILRIFFSKKKTKFIFSFHGIIDLAAIIPFYLSTGIDLRSIRIFRLFRLAQLFKLLRYSEAIKRLKYAFSSIKSELLIFIMLTIFLLYISAVGIYYFENAAQPEVFTSVFESLWWAVATLTTVGYGDIYPITVGGKVFTFLILLIGLAIVAVPTGLIASALSKTNK